jgi:hypothetical protein
MSSRGRQFAGELHAVAVAALEVGLPHGVGPSGDLRADGLHEIAGAGRRDERLEVGGFGRRLVGRTTKWGEPALGTLNDGLGTTRHHTVSGEPSHFGSYAHPGPTGRSAVTAIIGVIGADRGTAIP